MTFSQQLFWTFIILKSFILPITFLSDSYITEKSKTNKRLTVKIFQPTAAPDTTDQALPLGIPTSTYFPSSLVASYQLSLHQALVSLNGFPRFSSVCWVILSNPMASSTTHMLMTPKSLSVIQISFLDWRLDSPGFFDTTFLIFLYLSGGSFFSFLFWLFPHFLVSKCLSRSSPRIACHSTLSPQAILVFKYFDMWVTIP